MVTQPSLSLIVIRANDLERARRFYELLGLDFMIEQHGNGPIHYSTQLGNTILELYPGKPGEAPDRRQAGATMIGFRVEQLDEVLASAQEFGAPLVTPIQETEWGKRAVIQDPDGRAIELMQAT